MSYPLTVDDGPDDLPRTLRREKELREREARERSAADRAQAERETLAMGPPRVADPVMSAPASPQRSSDSTLYAMPDTSFMPVTEPIMPASVQRFDVPFAHLVTFFLKAAVAAIPALILLIAMMWVGGQVLKVFFPWLVKAQILIHFPN